MKTLVEFPLPETLKDSPVILAVFAHPDDETFSAGGALAGHALAGWSVKLVCATAGERATNGRGALSDHEFKTLRLHELTMAIEALGVDALFLLDWGDGDIPQRNAQEAVAELLKIMKQTAPVVVITFGPDGISGHPDHVALHRLTTEAFRQYARSAHPNDMSPQLYYVTASAAIPLCCTDKENIPASLPPTVRMDIQAGWERKRAAMEAYISQQHILQSLQNNPPGWQSREELFHRAYPPVIEENKKNA